MVNICIVGRYTQPEAVSPVAQEDVFKSYKTKQLISAWGAQNGDGIVVESVHYRLGAELERQSDP